MSPALLQFGSFLAALTLIMYAVVSFVTGAAFSSGAAVRAGLLGPLRTLRDHCSADRSDLADRTIIVGVVLCVVSLLAEQSVVSALVGFVLWRSRPQVQKLTASEHPLLALGSQVSGDLIIGLCAPLAAAHLFLGNPWLCLVSCSVIVALSWPTGGPGRRASLWTPLPVGA